MGNRALNVRLSIVAVAVVIVETTALIVYFQSGRPVGLVVAGILYFMLALAFFVLITRYRRSNAEAKSAPDSVVDVRLRDQEVGTTNDSGDRRLTGTVETSRQIGLARDELRSYRIVVDGARVGEIVSEEKVSLVLDAGEHEILLTMDWVRSRILRFHLSPDELRRFTCSARSAWRMPYDVTVGYRQYIRLDDASFAVTS
jgi:hypothetical protein